MNINTLLGKTLSLRRTKLGITLISMGQATGVSKSMIEKIEKGNFQTISLPTLEKICSHLGIKLSQVFLLVSITSSEVDADHLSTQLELLNSMSSMPKANQKILLRMAESLSESL